MKRLTAKRPVLYIGRMYKAGETLPANDQKMVTAWLGAGSAEWTGEQSAAPEQAAEVTGGAQDAQDGANGAGDAPQNGQGENGAQDGQGENGAQDGQKTAQDGANGAGDAPQNGQGENGAQDGQKTAQGGGMVEGNLDPAQLEGMNKDALLALAKDMGVDLPRGATKALIIERLAAVPVQAPASEDNGGAQ